MSKHLALAGPLAAVLLAGGCGDIMISISTDGRIEIFVGTMGADLDLDSFSVSVDGGAERIVPSGGAVTLTDLRDGSHSVRLSGMGEDCRVEGSNPRSVEVGPGGTASVAFEVRCARGTTSGFTLWSRRPATWEAPI